MKTFESSDHSWLELKRTLCELEASIPLSVNFNSLVSTYSAKTAKQVSLILSCVQSVKKASKLEASDQIARELQTNRTTLHNSLSPLCLSDIQHLVLMNKARSSIEYGASVTESAASIGMLQPSFSRLFKKMYSLSPSEFQRLCKNNENPDQEYLLAIFPEGLTKVLQKNKNWQKFVEAFPKKHTLGRQRLCKAFSILMSWDINADYSEKRLEALVNSLGITTQTLKNLARPISIKLIFNARRAEKMASMLQQSPTMSLERLGEQMGKDKEAARLFFTRIMGVTPYEYRQQLKIERK